MSKTHPTDAERLAAMNHIWLVQGVHAVVPGVICKAYTTKTKANREAASLVATIMAALPDFSHLVGNLSKGNWQQHLRECRKVDEGYDVWITKVEIDA